MRRLLNEDDITSRIDKKLHEVYSCPKTKYAEGYVAACKAVKRMLATLSPADSQPKRKTGTWIAVDYFADGKPAYREWECSACGCVVEDEKPTGNFCKMCGADMRGKQDDEQASTNND